MKIKKTYKLQLFFAVFACVLALLFSSTNVFAGSSPSFGEVVDHLDLRKQTSLHAKTYWKKMKGESVTWTAVVYDVEGGRGKAQVLAYNDSRRKYKGYNLVLITFDMEAAADLMVKSKIKFTGELYKYKGRKGNPTIIYLNNVEFMK